MTETTRQEQVQVDHNPGTLSLKISDLCAEGWRVDPDRPLTMLGFLWEVWMIRDADDALIQKDAEEAAKPSRAEILAKARAARAAKAAEQKTEAPAQEQAPEAPAAEEAPKEDAPKADATE